MKCNEYELHDRQYGKILEKKDQVKSEVSGTWRSNQYGSVYVSENQNGRIQKFVYPCECELNHDGRSDIEAFSTFGQDWSRIDCPKGDEPWSTGTQNSRIY